MLNNYTSIDQVLKEKYGIIDIDKAYLSIDYSKKTELINRHGQTVVHTNSYNKLLRRAEKILTEEIP
jgi:hypothetical protein